MLSVVPLSSVPSRHQREVRGLVVMTAVVMAAVLGNKQEEEMAARPSIQCSEATLATTDRRFSQEALFYVFHILIPSKRNLWFSVVCGNCTTLGSIELCLNTWFTN